MMGTKMPKKFKSAELPEWAVQITTLRERLKINQAELARRMACSAMTISRWERGLLQPSAEHFVQLGNLGNTTQAWFFWEMAGIQPAKMAGALKATTGSRKSGEVLQKKDGAGAGKSVGKRATGVNVPVLKAFIGAHGAAGDKRSLRTIPAKEVISIPAKWCPNPDYTSLVSVRGHGMEPLIRDGDIVAIDSFLTERASLYGKIVAVANQTRGLSVAYLRRYDTLDILEGENRQHEPVILHKAKTWRIVGKVLWWISTLSK
jgi:phage repressor protein C with HTH and peptisase S24 domain